MNKYDRIVLKVAGVVVCGCVCFVVVVVVVVGDDVSAVVCSCCLLVAHSQSSVWLFKNVLEASWHKAVEIESEVAKEQSSSSSVLRVVFSKACERASVN